MADSDAVVDAAIASVQKPAKVQTKSATVEQQDPMAMLDVADRLDARAARSSARRGLMISRAVPPSAVGSSE